MNELTQFEIQLLIRGLSSLYYETENDLKNGLVNNLDNSNEIQDEMNRIMELKNKLQSL
jgi:hypothetical protein